ncbi:MAG TPA: (2Fe-2S)-binding protein [Ramlibacter sp.]|nr:(2Fe-2S)-binding protein [Ramlibacter sp.]
MRNEQAPSCGQGMACLCAGVSHAELQEAISADGEATLESLGATLGCGVQCGSCIPALKEALGQEAWYPAVATARAITRASELEGMERLIYKVDLALAGDRPYPVVLPGQHIVLRAQTEAGPVERTYTVVSQDVDGRRLTIAVRRKPEGVMTPWLLADEAPVRAIEVSAPGGPGLSTRGTRSVVFFAAGVGVTPAVAMASALGASGTMHLDYSVREVDDAAFLPRFEARRKERPGFSYSVRETARNGTIEERDVREIVAAYEQAKFYICGPQGYVDLVHRALRRARVEPARIHVELFALRPVQAPAASPRKRAYTAGVLLSLLPALLLLPAFQDIRPHGHPNVGHEQLQCIACHAESPASTRQALQAKVKHALGLRETGAVVGMQPVGNATCTQCHVNSDDKHAPHRFLEPRFEQARAETGAQMCVSCHREHSQARVTAPTTNYCVSCHADLQVRNDKTSPTHEQLLTQKRWDTCLQCHDYHGNHKWSAPLRLKDAATVDMLHRYLKDGPSPYGPTTVKARQDKAS